MENKYKNNTRHQIRYEKLNEKGIKDINKWEKDNGINDKRYNFNLWINNFIKEAMKKLGIKPAGTHRINGKDIQYFEEEEMKRILDYIPDVDQFFYTPKRIVGELGNHGYKNRRSAMTRATQIAKELGIEKVNEGKPYLYSPKDAEKIKKEMRIWNRQYKAEMENENIQMQIDEPEDATELEETTSHLEEAVMKVLDSIIGKYKITIELERR